MDDSGGEGDVAAGHSCPETAAFLDICQEPGTITINGQRLHVVQASAEEQAAVQRMLEGSQEAVEGSEPPRCEDAKDMARGDSRPTVPAWKAAGAKLVGVLFLVAAVGAGLACGLGHHREQCAHHGPGHGGHRTAPVKTTSRRSNSGKRREEDEANAELQDGNDQDAPYPVSGHTLTGSARQNVSSPRPSPDSAIAESPSPAPAGEGHLPSVEKDLRPECEVRAENCPHRMPNGWCRTTNCQCRLFVGAGDVKEMLAGLHGKFDAVRKELGEGRDTAAAVSEDVARQVFAVVREMEAGGRWRKAPMLRVFRLYCQEGLTAQQVAKECGCSKSLVVLRLKQLRQKLGRDPAKLRVMSSHFEAVEDSISDSRAEQIRREGMEDG